MNDHGSETLWYSDTGHVSYVSLVNLFQALANPGAPDSMTWSPTPRELRDPAPIRSHP